VLQRVDVGTQTLAAYTAIMGEDEIDALREAARPLAGAQVLHISATPYGGGVAEILRSAIPLLRGLGIRADWRLVTGDPAFFGVTKRVHNALQGMPVTLSAAEKDTYLAYSARNAALLDNHYDLVVVHDPQPLAVPSLAPSSDSRWVWRCHIDTSEPNADVYDFLRPFFQPYDVAVFTLREFIPPRFPIDDVEIIPPAIDPESPKNISLPEHLARRVVNWIGIDTDAPLVTQISRFDPWKDPLGVIAVYQQIRQKVPDVQLVLAGSMALDDPEGWDMYREIEQVARQDDAIHVFTNLTGVGNVEVNALQRLSTVVIQKSIREGFGLVVSEALWKGTPVIAGRHGGIPLQLDDGASGYLVDTNDECAARAIELLEDPARRAAFGAFGHDQVRERFLLPRLITDEVGLYTKLLGSNPAHGTGTA
jgi:trehalose synthase